MTFYHFLEQVQNTPYSQAFAANRYAFAVVESMHEFALAILGGAVLLPALSVLGVGLKTEPAQIQKNVRPYLSISIIVLILTGTMLGVTETLKLYDRKAFWVKMVALAAALLVNYFVFNPMIKRGDKGAAVRIVAALTMALWLTVAIAGRWIGLS